MKKAISTSVLLVFMSFLSVSGQQWARSWYGGGGEYPACVIQTSDGGFIMSGYTNSFGAGALDCQIIKLNQYGEWQWGKTYGGIKDDAALSITQTDDGGYIAVGLTGSYESTNYDILVVKIFADGEVDWARSYGGTTLHCSANYVQQTYDGGYFVVGYVESSSIGGTHVLAMKLASNGTPLWYKIFGVLGWGYSGKQTKDEGYIITGGNNNWVIKLDKNGDREWENTYGSGGWIRDIIQTGDGGYAAVTNYVETNMFKLLPTGELDPTFQSSWYLDVYNGDKWLTGGTRSVQQTPDGGYIIAGYVIPKQPTGGRKIWLIKLLPSGLPQWEKLYSYGEGLSVINTSDGGFVAVGPGSYPIPGFAILKVASNGSIDSCAQVEDSVPTDQAGSPVAQNVDYSTLDVDIEDYDISDIPTTDIVLYEYLACQGNIIEPHIDSLSRYDGPPGTDVMITGTNFGSTPGIVTFNGAEAPITSWTDTQIETAVPSGATTGPVVVHTSDGRVSNGIYFTVTILIPPPLISQLIPEFGPVGTKVTISGSNFGAIQGIVTFGGIVATIVTWTDNQIEAIVPSGASTGPVIVEDKDARKSNPFTFTVDYREDVVKTLDRLRDWLVESLNEGTLRTAEVYAFAAQMREETKWWQELVRAFFRSCSIVLSTVNSVMSLDTFFSAAQNPALIFEPDKALLFFKTIIIDPLGIETLAHNYAGLLNGLDGFTFYKRALGIFGHDVDKAYKDGGFSLAQQYAFNNLYLDKIDNPVRIPERSGPMLPSGRPQDINGGDWAVGTKAVIRDINTKFDTLIANVPLALPEIFPGGQFIADMEEIVSKLKQGLILGNPLTDIDFACYPDQINEETRLISVGMLAQGRFALDQLWDAYEKNLSVHQTQTVISAANTLLYYTYFRVGPIGTPRVLIAKSLHTLVNFSLWTVPDLVNETSESEVDPMDAINALCQKMLDNLGQEAMNLWALSDGIISYTEKLLELSP